MFSGGFLRLFVLSEDIVLGSVKKRYRLSELDNSKGEIVREIKNGCTYICDFEG